MKQQEGHPPPASSASHPRGREDAAALRGEIHASQEKAAKVDAKLRGTKEAEAVAKPRLVKRTSVSRATRTSRASRPRARGAAGHQHRGRLNPNVDPKYLEFMNGVLTSHTLTSDQQLDAILTRCGYTDGLE
ncbi:hypothetical protein PR003_g10564 [Phytophthora rubi]|uniref:Uncharacterized protein n=1 Tax=Phytophthora rubi TaxID=129364 RepID=A0A6A4F5C2_9STRA|nr:hypothetical protein PR003_g10564 [Phytophthora rubi]